MVNPLGHWLWILFGTIFWITLSGLSGFRGIVFWVPLRRLCGFWVPPLLVVSAHPLLVPVLWYFDFSLSFLLLLNIFVTLLYGARLGGVLWHNLLGFSFPLPRICGNYFVLLYLWPNKIYCLLLWILIFFVRFMMLFSAVLSVATGVWWLCVAHLWSVRSRGCRFLGVLNYPSNSDSRADRSYF